MVVSNRGLSDKDSIVSVPPTAVKRWSCFNSTEGIAIDSGESNTVRGPACGSLPLPAAPAKR